jgi:hypothetical protein
MKMTSVVKCFLPLVLFLVGGFITGCATNPPVDWDSRVGHYTYTQAVHELGLPNRQIRLSSGATEFKWFLPIGAAGGSGLGMNNPGVNNNGINGMNNGLGVGHGASPGAVNRYLQLTFDANGVLTAWSKNY